MYDAVYEQSAWNLQIFQQSPDLPYQTLPHSSHVFSSINCNTSKLIPLKVIVLQSFLHFHENIFSVVVPCMLQTDANSSVI